MAPRRRSPAAPDWRQLAALGEQLLGEHSLRAQRDRIVSMAGRLVDGNAAVWLREDLFRLPDWEAARLFPPEPPLDGMRLAIKGRRVLVRRLDGNEDARGFCAALPLEDHGLVLGALQVSRPGGPKFHQQELDVLEGLGRIVAVGLFASHRGEVERFRLGQLNLVREVSAQIANVLNVDELSRRVTELIQKTFRYYYVAIFTYKTGADTLRFRSSASAPRTGKKKASVALEVQPGQGLIGEAAASGKQVVSDDVRADPRYRFIDSLPETRAEVVLPLKIEERVLGVLDVQSDQLRAFHPNDLLILSALADNIARAVESARLYGDLCRRADQLTLVAEVSKRVVSTLDLSELMRETATLIHDRFSYPYVALFSVHPRRRLIAFEAGSGEHNPKLAGSVIPLDDEHGIIPWVARTGRTVLANDVTQDARYRRSSLSPRKVRSELTVALKFNDQPVGVLDIQSERSNAFNEDDQLMFEAVADTIAGAIRNADLYRSERWRRQVSDSLREVAGLLSSHAGTDQVLETILSELERNLSVDVAAIWLLSEDNLVLAAIHGADADSVLQARRDSPEAARALTTALRSEVPLIRAPGDPMTPLGLAAGFAEDYSALTVPMRLGNQGIGLITLSHRDPGQYGHEAQAMTTTFAGYAAVAIENARLYDAAQEQAYASAALLQVAQAVVSLGSLEEILASIIRILPILVGIKRAALYLWDAERQTFKSAHEFGLTAEDARALTKREFIPGLFPLLEAAREQNRIVASPLNRRTPPKAWPKIPRESIRSTSNGESFLAENRRLLLAVPLSIKNDLYGVLLLEELEVGRRFRGRRIEIINGIAQQASLAIQNDRLQQEMVGRERLETEAQLARQIQQAFIPESLPKYPGWQLAARWRTARQVGGDFYDVIELPHQRLGLIVADVADKGMPAALFMALTRTLVRAAATDTDAPAEALRRVNSLLFPDTQQGMFVTAIYGVLDLESGDFTYVNAGHNPPLWVKRNGDVERLTRTGVALGVLQDANISQRSIHLGEGDLLLLYTDGLTEAVSADGDFYGEQRLIDSVLATPMTSAEELLDAVDAQLIQFAGQLAPSDDLTMMAVRRL